MTFTYMYLKLVLLENPWSSYWINFGDSIEMTCILKQLYMEILTTYNQSFDYIILNTKNVEWKKCFWTVLTVQVIPVCCSNGKSLEERLASSKQNIPTKIQDTQSDFMDNRRLDKCSQ